MAGVVNLNKFRKTRGKEEAAKRAAENRIRFGQRKDQQAERRRAADQAGADLDGKKLD